ncbi:hypothetical protein [Brachybacterium saurashtrense]|uniref:Uncharacterized protein n=1 Tax=Brachybacterium saurashtrense TaxID=556288 RepID=A0ABM6XDE1_9MICO|nr:hypothetical protein [Brachybacterium saurashtrense]AXK47084.1 hypothetical protein DWV08_16670 [Brachybacterium saurashtrense]
MRHLLGRRRTHHEPAFDGPRESTRRTEEQIIADLRAFHAATGATTCQAFTAWAREQGVPATRPRDPLRHLERGALRRRDRRRDRRPAQRLPR